MADGTKLDLETTPQFVLTVQVSDGGPAPARTDTATVTINLTDVNEFAPVLNDATFSVAENSANGTSVGTVTATDADATKTFGYSITAGNASGAFAINASTGQITVADGTKLDRETTPQFVLTVEVSDGVPAPARTDTATVTINLTDVNEFAPVLDDATFSVAENSANGTSVGTVTATDADATKTFSYSITAGNASGAFAINASTGQVTVADGTKLNRETTPQFVLTVEVSDGRPDSGPDGHGHGDDQPDGRERIRSGAGRRDVQRGGEFGQRDERGDGDGHGRGRDEDVQLQHHGGERFGGVCGQRRDGPGYGGRWHEAEPGDDAAVRADGGGQRRRSRLRPGRTRPR